MTSAGNKPKPLKTADVRKVINEALGKGSYIETLSLHARFDHLERKIDLNDVLFGLKSEWDYCEADEFDVHNWQWKYKIKTKDINERAFTIVLRLDPKNKSFHVVTRYPDD